MKKKIQLLELFKGTGSIGKEAIKRNYEIESLDIDPKCNATHTCDILTFDYKKLKTPDFLWASPPCNSFSYLQTIRRHRDPKTLEPLTETAKIGDKILDKTLEIIKYFKKKNPKMLWVIENPTGYMRKMYKMVDLQRDTTLYGLYGTLHRKSTDFFNNFPNNLNLKKGEFKKQRTLMQMKLSERYAIPPTLCSDILDQFEKQYQ